MEQRNLILAVVLSVVLLFVYTQFFAPPPTEPAKTAPAAQGKAATAPAPTGPGGEPAPAATPAPAAVPQPSRQVVVDTPLFTATFNERGGSLQRMVLKKFTNEPAGKGGEYVLLDAKAGDPLSLGLSLPKIDPQIGLRTFAVSAQGLVVKAGESPQALTFSTQSAGLKVTKTYTFKPDSYAFDLKVSINNQTDQPVELVSELSLYDYALKGKVNTSAFTGMLGYRDHRLVEEALGETDPNKTIEKVETGGISWMAMSIPYFMGAVAPEGQGADTVKRSMRAGHNKGVMSATLVEPLVTLGAGETQDQSYLVFYGPRDLDVLEPLGHRLDAAVDFGWFDLMAKPMLAALNFFFRLVGNYGVAIIIITILIKIVLWPISAKAYKSMKKMQELQPLVAKLRDKYKDDRARLQQETMQLYKTYKVNPMGGCLPMLVQFPVFIAFYKVLGSAIELRHAPFMSWINDLSAPDRLPIGFDFAIPYAQEGYGLPVLTILMGASMFLQQKMTPTAGDPAQAKIMLLMPVMFTFMFLNFPSGLVLYWLVQGILSIGQQWWTNQQKAKA